MCKLWRFNRKISVLGRTFAAKFPFLAALLPHNFRFSPHFRRTISVFRRTFAAQFGVIAKCGAALFGKNYRT
jgi:hypothetical protein